MYYILAAFRTVLDVPDYPVKLPDPSTGDMCDCAVRKLTCPDDPSTGPR